MQERVTIKSGEFSLSGIVHVPESLPAGEKRPAFIVLHGFGSNKDSSGCVPVCQLFESWGYVALRFDMRGCGESDGESGRIICLEQVDDTKAALTYMQSRADVDPARIGLIGSSFGAAVAVYTGGVDSRVAAVVSAGGWGDGESKFRKQHPSPQAWKKFADMLENGRRHRERTGESMMVPRYDIVPIPPGLRGNLAANSIQAFPAETAQSMFDFRANDVVGNIAPRPLLLLHPARDSVTPTEQSIHLFLHAGQPTELHLLADVDHFLFGEKNPRVTALLKGWLDRYLPAH